MNIGKFIDKKTLFTFTIFLIPGIFLLLSFFDTGFYNMCANSTEWYNSLTFVIFVTILSIGIGISSIILLIFGKNIPNDNIYDILVEKRKKQSTKHILKFLEDNGITSYTEEYVRKFVDDNYDEAVKNIR